MREIEIKLRVRDLRGLAEQLKARGCILSAPISQHDVIYSKGGSGSEWANPKEGNIIIRIRHLKNKSEFTLKQTAKLHKIEYETAIENPEAMNNILLTLGYTPEVEVKKFRRKGKLAKYEVCLDEVENLGTFIELEELTDENTNPRKVREELFGALETLGLSRADEETLGYDEQIYWLMHPDQHNKNHGKK